MNNENGVTLTDQQLERMMDDNLRESCENIMRAQNGYGLYLLMSE